MEDLKKALAEHLHQFNIIRKQDHFIVKSNEFFHVKDSIGTELVKLLCSNPFLFKESLIRTSSNLTSFPLICWIVSSTDLHSSLITSIFDKILNGVNSQQMYIFAFVFNYIRKFTYDEKLLKESAINVIPLMCPSVKPLFISLLPEIVNDGSCFFDMLSKNWKEGKRDLAMASLHSLLKFNLLSDSILYESHHFEAISDVNMLKNVVIEFPDQVQILSIFHKPLNQWIDPWSEVIQNCGLSKLWPYPIDNASMHSVDLLTILSSAALCQEKGEFKGFIERIIIIPEELLAKFFKDQLPRYLSQCTWLHKLLRQPLLQLFASLLKLETPSQKILLSLCQIFMDNVLGSSARKSFVNYIASHIERLDIGERCLNLIESFIDEFPASRYVCLALIKSLLDGVYLWEPKLLVPYYSSFALIARSSDTVMNDLVLLLKKQIYSSDPCYKRIGARGIAVLIIKISSIEWLNGKNDNYLLFPDESFHDETYTASCSQKQQSVEININTSSSKIDNYYIKMAISLLEDSIKSLRSDPRSMLIFLKLLNESFEVLVDEVKVWIGEWSAAAFQETFVVQIDDGDDDCSKNNYLFALDEDNPVAINFIVKDLLGCAPILLNLLSQNEKYHNSGSLESIDALQTCSILWNNLKTSDDVIIKFETINYFRVILNEFQDQKMQLNFQDSRLSNLIELQADFIKFIRNCKNTTIFSEFESFPETHSLLYISQTNNSEQVCSSSSFSSSNIVKSSFICDLIKEANSEKNGFNINKNSIKSLNLQDFTFIPLNIEMIRQELIEKIKDTNVENVKVKFLLREVEIGISLLKKDHRHQDKHLMVLIDFLFLIHPDDHEIYLKTIEIVSKYPFPTNYCKKDLVKLSQTILKTSKSFDLKGAICKFLVSYLRSADSIQNPKEILDELLKGEAVLKSKELLSLVEIDFLLEKYLQNTEDSHVISVKNQVIVLKHVFQSVSQKLKIATNIQSSQQLISIMAQLIQFSRSKPIDFLKVIIKESNAVLENLLVSNVLKLIEGDALIMDDRDSVLYFFKMIQQSTRSLQIICNHLKYSSNPASTIGIPALKRTLERVIFRIKELLQRSGCLSAFWMGNLKHRDLDGNELSSQVELKLTLESEHEDETIESSNVYLSEEFINSTDISSSISDDSEEDLENLLSTD